MTLTLLLFINDYLNKQTMDRSTTIWEITRIDTMSYRNVGMQLTGSYTHEPDGYRSKLYDVYNSLSDSNLEILYSLKVTSFNKINKN